MFENHVNLSELFVSFCKRRLSVNVQHLFRSRLLDCLLNFLISKKPTRYLFVLFFCKKTYRWLFGKLLEIGFRRWIFHTRWTVSTFILKIFSTCWTSLRALFRRWCSFRAVITTQRISPPMCQQLGVVLYWIEINLNPLLLFELFINSSQETTRFDRWCLGTAHDRLASWFWKRLRRLR